MKDRLVDLSWKKALVISIGISFFGIPIGIVIGLLIAFFAPEWPTIVYEVEMTDPIAAAVMIGISNAVILSTVIGAAFLIATGVAPIGSHRVELNPLSNYPRENVQNSPTNET
ncbi:MAG: hypothetical protein KF824_02270 [Fimbriimonadaceae bacterium]|nr:MAG: hypothetical protein KF824_02270 [Fimbriimonadaceae bacterium]